MNQVIPVTIIIPCFQSACYLSDTVSEIIAVFKSAPSYSLQLILVDDASPDHTSQVIHELCQACPEVTGICLSSNVGQACAKMKGVPAAEGEYTVFMDDDGQHDPSCIFDLIKALEQSSSGQNGSSSPLHLVYARFPSLKESFFRRIASFLSNQMLVLTTGKPRSLTITSYFAIDRTALEALRQYKSSRPFIGGYLWHVFGKEAVGSVAVRHRKRAIGRSTYTLPKLVRTWIRLNTSMREIRTYPRWKETKR